MIHQQMLTSPYYWSLKTHLQQYFTLSYFSSQCCRVFFSNVVAQLFICLDLHWGYHISCTQNSPDKAIFGRWIVNLNFFRVQSIDYQTSSYSNLILFVYINKTWYIMANNVQTIFQLHACPLFSLLRVWRFRYIV